MFARFWSGIALAAALAAFLAVAAPAGAATSLPAGFEEQTLADSFAVPSGGGAVDVAWAPDGRMFVADRSGRVFVHNPGAAHDDNQLVLDIGDHANNDGDRGLLGIATDSAFAGNGYLYLLYTYDEDGSDSGDRKVSTLTRVTVHPDNSVDGGVTTPDETTILGGVRTVQTGPDGACGLAGQWRGLHPVGGHRRTRSAQ